MHGRRLMQHHTLFVVACLGGLVASCATSHPAARSTPTMGVTNLQVERTPSIDPRTTQSVEALAARDYAKVLALTEPSADPRLDCNRGSALTGLQRTDEAVEVFKRAELRFRDAGDDKGRASAMWGLAYALDEAGRCDQARAAYEKYQDFVRLRDPHGAELAAANAGSCRLRVIIR